MDKKTKQALIGTSIALLFVVIIFAAVIIKKLTPSKEIMKLTDYYPLEKGEVLMIMQDRVYDQKALIEDGNIYVDYNTVIENFNKRFYWDNTENILSYTTPTEIIKTELGKKDYYVNKNKKSMDFPVVKSKGDKIYISIEFVKQFSDINYNYFKSPNRIVVQYKFGDFLYSKVKKATQLRYEPNIKSDILKELKKDDALLYVDTDEVDSRKFSKVMTEDGVIGYVKNKSLQESYYETLKSDFVAPEYTHITKEGTVNLAWNQVTNQEANKNLVNLLEDTKGVTVISPTWFSVDSNDGTITSLASETYVERAHSRDVEVWALVDDFNTELDMYKLLSQTSSREKLVNELIAEAIKYNLDGLNIDFEKIPSEAGTAYIEFVRELSVKCRNNGIILSIDNYVPRNYSAYYDREEQGNVVDYVIIMAYDEHTAGSEESGSVASIGFVGEAIEKTLTMVPKERIIIGIPFYTRLWKEVNKNGKLDISSEAYSMTNAANLIKDNDVKLKWDDSTGQYYGEYVVDDATYKIWMEEDDSIDAKLKLIHQADIAGVACWKLGLEKNSIWDVVIKYLDE